MVEAAVSRIWDSMRWRIFINLPSAWSLPALFYYPSLHPYQRKKPKSKSKLCYGRRPVGQPVLVSGHHLGPTTSSSLSSMVIILRHLLFFYYGVPSLTRGGLYSCSCAREPSLSRVSPTGLMITFHCFDFGTPPIWSARFLYMFSSVTG
jgi:hypothetical protein